MAWSKESRHARGYGREHEKIRADMMRRIILCEECRRHDRVSIGTIADHIKPLSRGGTGDRSNYQLLCKPCSDAKTLADKGQSSTRVLAGVDVTGRPTHPGHPWNRR